MEGTGQTNVKSRCPARRTRLSFVVIGSNKVRSWSDSTFAIIASSDILKTSDRLDLAVVHAHGTPSRGPARDARITHRG